ncbi:hypothetical protein K450DRAFT_181212 [Umbelopsis ramanniana AG]|uniref:PEBP-like protein n=1 Tax=Umbelopsis ramanniana AG TaxID=1314678 RepID=A0AAD5E2A7_UMBRA|nr:uncharacterized protein K450DRAFT_181212 [Umbelopsis ramanniana AG]KAI8575180.1 hypothetical protein K450DRAFT_181212 [Umbelopsis ramanniana AG]
MPSVGQRIEAYLGNLLSSKKGRDAGLLTRQPQFEQIEPTLKVTSDIGPSGTIMPKRYGNDGGNELPTLTWEAIQDAQEYFVISEDPDVPLPTVATHGILYGISPEITSIQHADIKDVDSKQRTIKNGSIKYGKTLMRTPYEGPRPPLNHGAHRYIYTVVALKHPLENLPKYPGKTDFLKVINEDNVLAWGEWIGVYERKLE